VDDEEAIREVVSTLLEAQGYSCTVCANGRLALEAFRKDSFDLALSDIVMPEMDGLKLLSELRNEDPDVPVIMVTARTEDQDAVRGLNTGADDYIAKPFSMEALLARMRALLRRSNALPTKGQLAFHDITMDLAAYRVQRNGRAVHLGPTEFRLLEFFMQHPRRVFSREELLGRVGARHSRRAAHSRCSHPPAAQVHQRRRRD